MAVTAIEWADLVWNATTGCDRISPGCQLCYAMRMAPRLKAYGNPKYQNDGDPRTSGPGFGVTEHHDVLDAPFTQSGWGGRKFVFVDSMSDLLHAKVSLTFLAQVIDVMQICEQHTFLVLTKRAERLGHLEAGLPNLWAGVSVESMDYYRRIEHLAETRVARRFLSLEPLLGPLHDLPLAGIDWVICGGESGPGARPMHPAWVREIRDQCVAAGVPLWFKQWGAWAPRFEGDVLGDFHSLRNRQDMLVDLAGHVHCTVEAAGRDAVPMSRVGKKNAGHDLDGRIWMERPPHHEMAVPIGTRERPRRPIA